VGVPAIEVCAAAASTKDNHGRAAGKPGSLKGCDRWEWIEGRRRPHVRLGAGGRGPGGAVEEGAGGRRGRAMAAPWTRGDGRRRGRLGGSHRRGEAERTVIYLSGGSVCIMRFGGRVKRSKKSVDETFWQKS
jgi:hypothetical protein